MATKLESSYSQPGNDFILGDIIYPTGNNVFAKGQSNAVGTAGAALMVTEAGSTFKAVQPGSMVTGLSGLTAGNGYLSPTTAGKVVSAPPSAPNIVKPVGYAINATTFLFDPLLGVVRGATIPGAVEAKYILSRSGEDQPVVYDLTPGVLGPTLSDMVWYRGGVGVLKFGDPAEVQAFPYAFGCIVSPISFGTAPTVDALCDDNLAIRVAIKDAGVPTDEAITNVLIYVLAVLTEQTPTQYVP